MRTETNARSMLLGALISGLSFLAMASLPATQTPTSRYELEDGPNSVRKYVIDTRSGQVWAFDPREADGERPRWVDCGRPPE